MKRILITPGEPAGIGPDITLDIANLNWPAEIVVVADPDLLLARAKQLHRSIQLIDFDPDATRSVHQPGTLKIFPCRLLSVCEAGKLNPANASYVLQSLNLAVDFCLAKKADAMVTGPVHKGVINLANIPFTGHTEFLANRMQVLQPVMLFVTAQSKVGLVTTHLPLTDVPSAITVEKLTAVITTLQADLKKWFQLSDPHIVVCGLNPHAGEQGHLGREEIETIEPALHALRQKGFHISGPLPADTVFTEKYLATADVVLAMYHDQALPVVKYMSFGQAVNVTLGLPILRTSVDHGTALDIAGSGGADAGSLVAAIELAIDMNDA